MYVINSELLTELKDYKLNKVMSEKLGYMLLSIANNLASKGCFAGYTWKEDMIGEAMVTCTRYLHNFNPEQTLNAFAYVTTICKNSFLTYIKNQRKHGTIRDSLCAVVDRRKELNHTLESFNYCDLK